MKFKLKARKNKLFERITSQHLVVGINIAQQAHVAMAKSYSPASNLLLSIPLNYKTSLSHLMLDAFDAETCIVTYPKS
ncbi:hypothetical protein ACFVQB_19455 [Paenibacillus sp. NPDC057886]|uniref:hypothetical protein n=1 Tax=Paenibacillus sp. NPDC057886 TaxID=3346270 RepID=UPI0036A98E98